MKNGCLVYYGSLIGYQAKDQAEVTVQLALSEGMCSEIGF